MVSGKNFSTNQINSIADSLIISISKVTKDITKEMFLSNTKEPGGVTEITISDLYNFITNVTEESINRSTYASLIASSRENFNTDNGNVILDVHNLEILEPIKMEQSINDLPGVITNGIFALRPADRLLVSNNDGIDVIEN